MPKDITGKVTRILSIILEHGYITNEILYKITNSVSTGWRYMKLLTETGYIESFPTYSSGSLAYCLTQKGWAHLAAQGRIRVLKNYTKSDYTPSQFYHTVAGIEVRLIFESHPYVVDYRPSRVLKYSAVIDQGGPGVIRGKQCDAELILQTKEGRFKVGVEIELTQKKSKTIASAYMNLSAHRQDLTSVLWLCASDAIIKIMQKVYKANRENLTSKPEHFFILLDEFKLKKFEADWVDLENNKVKVLSVPESLPRPENK